MHKIGIFYGSNGASIESSAVENEYFTGLPIDEDNEYNLTDQRFND